MNSAGIIRGALLALCLTGAGQVQCAVTSRAELMARMASGPTALDALTPDGKRAFLDSLRWGDRGLGGFSTAPLVRELNAAQVADVLRLLDSEQYLDMLTSDLGDSTPLRFAAPSADIQAATKAFHKFHDADVARRRDSPGAGTEPGASALVRYYHAAYAAYTPPNQLITRQGTDLLLLFDVAQQVVATSGDARALVDLRALFTEFRRRGIDTRRTLDDAMLHALLAGRRFGAARAFADAHPRPGRAAIAREVDPLGAGFKGRSVYRFDAATNTLERSAVAPVQGIELVLVVDAGCHFSEAALQAIGSDASLHERLRRAGLLAITSPRTPIPTRFMAEWNAQYPLLDLRAPFSAEEWSEVDVTEVPTFFILENGRVRNKIAGWPGQEQKAVLLRALDGLAP